ncbi:c-type cytochrome [Pontibacter vulgaris]|uniref:c-type cytochrome n=1 Tax=Pontibacter vulgaris TaxID=2905679 RepID=UPI001FA75F82|nr:c-type cytochrome [Pontibacter vulgaris]
MKKIVTAFGLCALLASCGGNKSEYEDVYDNKNRTTEENTAEATEPGLATTTPDTGTAAPTPAPQDNATVAKETETAAATGDFSKGSKLISMSDCLACHNEEKKIVGPAYIDVAKKYEFNDKNVDYLAGKIIKGGKGVWGEVPMTPHPNISEADAKDMARYVLSLNKK